MGFKKYKDAEIIRSSGEELFTKEFLENYMKTCTSTLRQAKAVQRVTTCSTVGRKSTDSLRSLSLQIQIQGGHFKNRSSASDEIIIGEDKDTEELDTAEEEEGERSTMHLLGRRNLSAGFYNHELVCELEERGKLEEAIFGPKESP